MDDEAQTYHMPPAQVEWGILEAYYAQVVYGFLPRVVIAVDYLQDKDIDLLLLSGVDDFD